ncbi:hypothetical protein [Mesobacillus harenae]|uniref:hypothetical protein n=1 Tax=Mesobacillus harenae TaxID=2213203 RepID=UPI001580F3E0|nr:hypothetical protein [Mesobacillus harenae]
MKSYFDFIRWTEVHEGLGGAASQIKAEPTVQPRQALEGQQVKSCLFYQTGLI